MHYLLPLSELVRVNADYCNDYIDIIKVTDCTPEQITEKLEESKSSNILSLFGCDYPKVIAYDKNNNSTIVAIPNVEDIKDKASKVMAITNKLNPYKK